MIDKDLEKGSDSQKKKYQLYDSLQLYFKLF